MGSHRPNCGFCKGFNGWGMDCEEILVVREALVVWAELTGWQMRWGGLKLPELLLTHDATVDTAMPFVSAVDY